MSTEVAAGPASHLVEGAKVPKDHPLKRAFASGRARGLLRVLAAVLAAAGLFGLVMLLKGVNPLTAYQEMLSSTFRSWDSMGDILVKAAPIVLAGLAVAVPARAGLINVGGEGQLIIGGVAAIGVSLAVDGRLPGTVVLVLMVLVGMVAGALWSAAAAGLKLGVGISESVTTLLMNYLALNLMFFLTYDRWKDPNGSGQPATRPVPVEERLPVLGDSRVHVGIVIAILAAVVLWWALRSTRWGFRLGVVGGNPEAARRAALPTGTLLVSAMAVGGALAGLGGVVQLAGAEFALRPGFLVSYGYIGFLASWLAGHRPLGVAAAGVLLAAISIGGDSLQIDSQLPAASVNILMALTLLVVFGFGSTEGGGMTLFVEVAAGGVRGGTSILYAALGESVSERGGVVNLGIEGSMLCGALAAYAVAAETGSPWLGVAAGALAGALLSLVHAYFVISRQTNQLATGLVVLFLGLGLTSLFGVSYVQALAPTFRPVAIPGLSSIPVVGEILFEQDPLVYLSFALVPLIWWIVQRSRQGVLLRAAGERSEVLLAHGHHVKLVQYVAVVAGGGLAGIGGAQLAIAYTKAWFENMAQGHGFVAVAVVMFAGRDPWKIMAGSYLFGAALALSPALQARGYGINQFALNSIPYAVTLLVLIVLGRRRAQEVPEGLAKVFETSRSG